MKDSAKIWYSIRRGTLRIALAAFAACAAATVPANVVRNDLVTATSDAELETSDRGMGLGINVVGGGDAVITLETRPGWRFRDGSTTYTMKKLAGVDARSPEIVNEGSTVESGGEISAGETEKEKPEEEKPEEKEPEEGGVEHVPPEVSISVMSVPTAAAYALPANSATVAFELSASVKSDAEHWETDKNGNKTKGPETFSPDEYVWKAVASNTVTAACVEWSTTSSGKSVTGALQLGKGAWEVTFSVYAKATCSTCNETVESAEDDEVRTVTVYEVSINRPDYLGLDQTDAGRKGHTVTNATIVTDPDCTDKLSGDAVIWTACGNLCEFKDAEGVERTNGVKVCYRNKGPDKASGAVRAEPLTAKVSIPGAEDVYCTTNFTVVKVDVRLKNEAELKDEKNGVIIGSYVKRDGTGLFGGYPDLAEKAMSECPMKVDVFPNRLPNIESITLKFTDKNLIVNDKPEVAKSCYNISEVKKQDYYLFDESGNCGRKAVEVLHENSSAVDLIGYDVCCCTFTVYTDVSDLFIEGAWYEKVMYFFKSVLDDMGHSFCKIDIDSEHQRLLPEHLAKYIGKPYGFYPNSDGHGGKTNEFYDVDSLFMEEDTHFRNVGARKSGTASHVWHISFDGCKKGLQRMYEIETIKPKYDLMCFNCTDAAISIGRACGAPVPDAGIPDLSVLESIYGMTQGNNDWAQKVWNLWNDSDGSYSSPLGLLVNLKYTNVKYGEEE